MEGNDNQNALKSYYAHHRHQTPNPTTTHSNSNNSYDGGMYSNNQNHYSSTEPVFSSPHSHSLPTNRNNLATPAPPPLPLETVKRKRGRPRKYGAPSSSSLNNIISSPPRNKEPSSGSSSKKSQLLALGNAGQSFTPHIITVAAGEDAAQKILSFMQQTKCALCILSASGSISNASLCQPATLGGNVTYEGRFEILSLSGSFLYSEIGGSPSRTGGLSVCLSGTDGRIIGGRLAGPLRAAGPVQVIAGTFFFDAAKDKIVDKMPGASLDKPPPQVPEASITSVSFQMAPASFERFPFRENDHQNIGGNFMLQPTSPGFTDWRSSLDARSDIEFAGRTDHMGSQSPDEDGDA